MKHITSITLMLLVASMAVQGQGESSYLKMQVHYESMNLSPLMYFKDGDQIKITYDHTIGATDMLLKSYTLKDRSFEGEELVADSLTRNSAFTYKVTNTGCYSFVIKPVGKMGYSAGSVTLSAGVNTNSPMLCAALGEKALRRGSDQLTGMGISGKKRKTMTIEVKKEISSGGSEFLVAPFDLRAGDIAIVNLQNEDDSPRSQIWIYKEDPQGNTTLFRAYQHGLTDFSFRSLKGGKYIVRLWGTNIFDRTEDLKIEITH